MSGGVWVWIIGASLLGGYGLLNLLAPGVTIRWQRRSTDRSEARGDAMGTSVGAAFASLVGSEGEEPWDDTSVRRRVRWIGVGEVVLAAVLLAPALALMN